MKAPAPTPRVRWRRVLFPVGGVLVTLLGTVGFVGFSVWIEDRFPSSDPDRALLPAAQKAVTKPIVSAISHQVERYLQERAAHLQMVTGLTVEETIERFLDERVDLARRRLYAFRLARVGSPECVVALLKVFRTAPPEHKAFMAELIGTTGNLAAKSWLRPFLDDPDERVVAAGIRGLSALGGDDVSVGVAAILADSGRAEAIRIEAARGLATLGTPASREALVLNLNQAPSRELATQILNSLGQFDFPAVASTFEEFLAAPKTLPALRVAAIEALAESSPEAVPFLKELAGRDADSAVRASAAWAISAHDSVKDLGPELASMAEQEPAADVRRRLYEALLVQTDVPAERLLPTVRMEQDIAARVAGFNAVGYGASQQPASVLALTFDEEIVPELLRIATAPNSLNIQMRAVFALRRVQTNPAQAALAVIANSARPEVATAARHGLRPPQI
jgi:HEAT repeat protein